MHLPGRRARPADPRAALELAARGPRAAASGVGVQPARAGAGPSPSAWSSSASSRCSPSTSVWPKRSALVCASCRASCDFWVSLFGSMDRLLVVAFVAAPSPAPRSGRAARRPARRRRSRGPGHPQPQARHPRRRELGLAALAESPAASSSPRRPAGAPARDAGRPRAQCSSASRRSGERERSVATCGHQSPAPAGRSSRPRRAARRARAPRRLSFFGHHDLHARVEVAWLARGSASPRPSRNRRPLDEPAGTFTVACPSEGRDVDRRRRAPPPTERREDRRQVATLDPEARVAA